MYTLARIVHSSFRRMLGGSSNCKSETRPSARKRNCDIEFQNRDNLNIDNQKKVDLGTKITTAVHVQ